MRSSHWQDMRTMLLIVLIAMSGLMGIDIHLASMPYIMKYMHANVAQTQQSISFYLLGFGLSLFVCGPLSDKYGRKPIVLFGLLFAGLTSIAAIFTHNIVIFLISRFLQGIGAGACAGLGRTMAIDMFHKRKMGSMRSYFSGVVGLSPLLAPVLGAYLQHCFGWRANFIFLGALFFSLAFLFHYYAPEMNRHIRRDLSFSATLVPNYLCLLKEPIFMAATLLGGIGMAINIAYAMLSPFIFQINYHLSPVVYGWITMGVSAGVVLGRLLNGYVNLKMGEMKGLLLGICLIVVPSVAIVIFDFVWDIDLIFTLLGIFVVLCGLSFVRVNAMFFALMPHHGRRGSAGALFGGFQMLVAFLGGVVISLFSYEGIELLFSVYLMLGLFAFLAYFILFRLWRD